MQKNKTKNPIKNLWKYYRKYGLEKTWEDWKYQYVMLDTPEQRLRKEIAGYVGMMGALLLAMVMITWRGLWYVGLVMLFSLWIAYTQFKGKLQALQSWKDIPKAAELAAKNMENKIK